MTEIGQPAETGRGAASPLVTIYVPSHEYGHHLGQALDSILAQIYTNWELVIIDDGSTDDTPQIAEQYVALEPNRIRLLRNEVPHGLQAIANRVLVEARGKYIMRLDADDWLDESALIVLVARAEADDSPAIVYGGYHYVDVDGKLIGTETSNGLQSESGLWADPPHGAVTLVSVAALRAVGGYSTDVDAQDGWDLWFKLIKANHVSSVTTPLFYYRQHGNSLSRSEERLYRARSIIFEQQANSLPRRGLQVLAVIPVKASNPDLPDLPQRHVGGMNVLERALFEAQSSAQVSQTVVTSEEWNILDFSRSLESKELVAPHLRVQRSAGVQGTSVPLSEILRHAGEAYTLENHSVPDVIVFLSLNAILRTSTEISNVINTLRVTGADVAVSVTEERNPVFVQSPRGLQIIGNGRFDNLLYRDEHVLRFNGIAIAAQWEAVVRDRIWGGNIVAVQMPRRLGLTLTDEESFARAERILNARRKC